MTVEESCYEVPITEKLRSVPKDYRTCVATQWSEDGTETGHRFIPVGYMMHEAADEIERLRGEYNRAIEDAARIPYGMGDEGCYQQIMELKK